jgi:hypothetical protein
MKDIVIQKLQSHKEDLKQRGVAQLFMRLHLMSHV